MENHIRTGSRREGALRPAASPQELEAPTPARTVAPAIAGPDAREDAARGRGPAAGAPEQAPLRIAVDFDGVLFDHIPYLLRGFRDAHGIDLEAEGLRHWDFFQYRAVRDANLTWACVSKVLKSIDTDPVIHELPPRDLHARRVMQRWRRAGHHVSIVTARDEVARTTTEAFLRRNDIPHDNLVMGARIKTGYDVLVDDAPHNVLMAAADGGLALLMDHPYNRDVPTKRNPVRVHHWREVAACIEQIAPKVAA